MSSRAYWLLVVAFSAWESGGSERHVAAEHVSTDHGDGRRWSALQRAGLVRQSYSRGLGRYSFALTPDGRRAIERGVP